VCIEEAPSGFEPLFAETRDGERPGREPVSATADELPEALRRVVERVSSRQREGADA